MTCGALPDGLLESELFGHARGAFTGAVRDRPGKIEAADKGTLFLDEIGNASPDLQQRLLRVLQDKTFERLGEVKTRTVDVRVIAATNEDLAAAVNSGRFREDLFWRVRVVALRMPALRDRQGDVPLLVEHFLDRFRREHGRTGLELEPACVPLLAAWPWRGNVRELEHCLERAVLLAKGPRILPPELGLPHPGGRAGRAGVIGTRIGFSSGPGTGAWADSEDGGTDDPARTLSELLRPLIGGPQPPTLKEALAIPEREIIRLALELPPKPQNPIN
jgi:DNA-binding NtrC family response regulator